MARLYGAYVLRCWRLDGGAERVEVAHVQSGERAVVASLAAALAWIGARADNAPGDRVAAPGSGQEAKGVAMPDRSR